MEKTESSRERILESAKKLFAIHGFEGTTTREIANMAGVNVSLISYYFGGKENLLFAFFDHFMDTVYQENLPVSDGTLVEEFFSILKHIINLRFDDPELVSILHHEMILSSARSKRIKQYLIPVWKRIKVLLEEGKRRGVFSFHHIESALAFTMSVAIFPWQSKYSPVIDPERSLNQEEIVCELIEFITKSLCIRFD